MDEATRPAIVATLASLGHRCTVVRPATCASQGHGLHEVGRACGLGGKLLRRVWNTSGTGLERGLERGLEPLREWLAL